MNAFAFILTILLILVNWLLLFALAYGLQLAACC